MKFSRFILSAVLTLMLCSFVESPMEKPDFQVDGINYKVWVWEIDGKEIPTDTVWVCAGSLIPASGKLVIPETVDYGGKIYTVGYLNHAVFEDRKDLKEIILPSSLQTIPGRAFGGCENLISVDIPEKVHGIGVWAFRGCNKLKEITLPASVRSISGASFEPRGLRSLTLGKEIKDFDGEYAFSIIDQKYMNLDMLTVMATDFELENTRCKVLDFKGKHLKIAPDRCTNKGKCESKIETILLPEVDGPYPIWRNGNPVPFASKCTVYVPDRLVGDFRNHPDWQSFKEILPISSYKGKK